MVDSGMATRFDELVAADFIVALGDYTGGAAEALFTLTSHGLVDGDILYCVGQWINGVVLGGVGTRAIVNELSSSTFQLTTDGSTLLTGTADGVGYFLKGNGVPQRVVDMITPKVIVGGNDFTGGTVEDMNFTNNLAGCVDGDTIKLLYKSAAGAAGVAADATAFVKAPVSTVAATSVAQYFQTSLTSGGAVIDTTADGTNLWLKTS